VDGHFLSVGLEITLAERPSSGVDWPSDGGGEKGGHGKKSGGEHYERLE